MEKQKIRYIQNNNLQDLEKAVNFVLEDGGWELVGTVQIIQPTSNYGSHFIQCVKCIGSL